MRTALVVGGGMAGLSAALSLASLDVQVTVLEPTAASEAPPGGADFDLRVSALTHASEHFLKYLGAWSSMVADRVSPYRGMQVWDAEGTGSIGFEAVKTGVTHLGHLVENRVTMAALLGRVQVDPRVTQVTAALQSLVFNGERYRVTASDGSVHTPDLLVGADGAQSRLRDLGGLPVREWAYGQAAIVTTVRCEKSHQDTCWQSFTADGPLALLPLRGPGRPDDGHVCSVVWSQEQEHADALMVLDETAFAQVMAQTFEHRLGRLELIDRRVTVPLVQRHAVTYVRGSLVLVGDAAHSIHPLAGQGINLGFMDVATLVEELASGMARGLPFAHESTLRRYQRRRKSVNLAMMAAMEVFRHGYGRSHWALQVARNWGMSEVDRHAMLKQWIVEHAMGLRGDIPAMATGGLRVSL